VSVCLCVCGVVNDQGSMLGQIDRYIKQAIVDNNDVVSSAALLCGLQLSAVRLCVVLCRGTACPLPFPCTVGCARRDQAMGERSPDRVDDEN
jgi:hypothetical protein